tara:strand:- start:230 stop:1933 length:1704 start_codon:yes stop_codon:yes gene_type:complete
MEGLGIGLIIPLLETLEEKAVSLSNNPNINFFDQITFYIFNIFKIKKTTATLLIIIAFFFILKSFFNFLTLAYIAKERGRLLLEIKNNIFGYYSSINYTEFIKKNSGDMVNLLNVQTVRALQAFQFCNSTVMSTVSAAIYFFIIILINLEFSLLMFVGGLILIFLMSLVNKYILRLSRAYTEESGILAKLFIQTIAGFKYLLATNRILSIKPKILKSIKNLSSHTSNISIASAFSSSLREPISVVFIFLIVYIQIEHFNVEIESIVVTLILLYRCLSSLSSVQENYQQALAHIGSIESIVENTGIEIDNNNKEIKKKSVVKINGSIKLDSISYSYNRGSKKIIDNLSLEIPAKKIVAIVGDSGSGKTTLLDLIIGILHAEKGNIFIDEKNSKDLDHTSWRKMIGYVSQNEFIFNDTIANNISFWGGDWKEDKILQEKIVLALKKADLFDAIKVMPDGLDTIIGDRGALLSGGQKQRLFIAREIFKLPELLIFDEATSALDHNSESIISETIKKMKGSLTIIIIVHNLNMIKNADLVYVLKEGKIAEKGSYKELIKKDRSYISKMGTN